MLLTRSTHSRGQRRFRLRHPSGVRARYRAPFVRVWKKPWPRGHLVNGRRQARRRATAFSVLADITVCGKTCDAANLHGRGAGRAAGPSRRADAAGQPFPTRLRPKTSAQGKRLARRPSRRRAGRACRAEDEPTAEPTFAGGT